jgi:hypothetical protein
MYQHHITCHAKTSIRVVGWPRLACVDKGIGAWQSDDDAHAPRINPRHNLKTIARFNK